MKILLIAPYFKPYNNPRSLRWSHLVDEMLKKGHVLVVICSNFSKEIESPLPKGLSIIPVGFNSLQEYLILKKQSTGSEKAVVKKNNLAYKLHQLFWKPYIFPDESFIWRKPALKKALELQGNDGFDAMISVGLPFSAHLVGKEIKEAFPELPWIMDVGDPYALQDYHPISNPLFYKKRSRILERACLNLADRVVVTTAKMVTLYHEAYEIEHEKINVIPPMNGLEFEGKFNKELSSNSDLSLGYFGSFFKNIREPETLLLFSKELLQANTDLSSQVTIHFYGEGYEKFDIESSISKFNLPIELHSKVDRIHISEQLEKMDVLLHLGNKGDFQIPSKIAEYICSGKPFIHLSQTENDPVLSMVNGLNWCKVIYWKDNSFDIHGLTEFLKNPPKADAGILKVLRTKFGPEKLAGDYLSLLLTIK